jgi:hypothetical protein
MKHETFLKIWLMAEGQWLTYARDVLGVDVSQFPSHNRYFPELGITHKIVYYPDALKPQFWEWMNTIYLPSLAHPPKDDA